MADWAARAADLDAADRLRSSASRFVDRADGVVAYFDGNSLGRPVDGLPERMAEFVRHDWGGELIRGWDGGWMSWPETIGDVIGAAVLGATPGQTVVADSTTVLLYKLARALIAVVRCADRGRDELVLDAGNFPTDRYVVEGIAAECGLRLRWIDVHDTVGVTPDQARDAVSERTALVVFSHVDYRSGYVAEIGPITDIVHDAGAMVLWDTCHSAGVMPIGADALHLDAAVGCSYKYLNGGPGAPAYAYLARRHHDRARQPIQGWMGRRDPFAMAPGYEPAAGVRQLVSGTPPIVSMVPVRAGVEMIAEAGIDAIRAKSLDLTDLAMEIVDSWPSGWEVELRSPRDHEHRGGHVTLARADFELVNQELWRRGVIPDFRRPDEIRIGLAPLSTTFAEVACGLDVMASVIGR